MKNVPSKGDVAAEQSSSSTILTSEEMSTIPRDALMAVILLAVYAVLESKPASELQES